MSSHRKPSEKSEIYLVGQVGSFADKRLGLSAGRYVVGRDPTKCQIVLRQAIVSGIQAVLDVKGDNRVFLKNLSDKNTTYVNQNPISECELKNGDLVGFGTGGMVSFLFHQEKIPVFGAPENGAASLPATAFGADFTPAATKTLKFSIGQTIRIGRASDNDVCLDSLNVSRHHAILNFENGVPFLADLNSSNGTFVNGEILRDGRALKPRDLICIGHYLLTVNGKEVTTHDLSASRITAYNITKKFGEKTILTDISLAFYPREFIGLMGPSGCGKSTLMDALNGLRPASSGKVLVNDLDLYENFDSLRRSIGYVPQKDVLHDALTVERTLFYAAKLRLPVGTTNDEISRVVGEVIETVGLNEQKQNPFKQLSGGQQKRLSLGIELITKPSFIFLDEPTSPLDPETTENMMLLFRRLADEGRIVVMVTHKFEKFDEMRRIVMLTKGGRLAFFGTPSESLEYFKVGEPTEIYHRISEKDAASWEREFRASVYFQKHIAGRINETNELLSATKAKGIEIFEKKNEGEKKFGFSQWLTLTRRYLEIKLNDRRNTLLLLIQAPIVALILSMITGDAPNDAKTLFISAIIAIWFGANNAVREIVSENTIYTRERLVNLKIPSYVFSKFAVLSGIGLLQCLLFIVILLAMGRFKSGDFLMLTGILYATLLVGIAIGLFFSALVSSTEKAMSILPLILIPQLLLSGFLKPVDDLYVNLKTGKPAAVEDYRKYDDEKKKADEKKDSEKTSGHQGNQNAALPANLPPQPPSAVLMEPITKYEGLGAVRYIAALMAARWTMDALAHQVSIGDLEARDKLAANMTIAEYENVLEKKPAAEIEKAYAARVRLDLLILGGFCAAFLALTNLALKRKDIL